MANARKKILIRGGRVIVPLQELDEKLDVLIDGAAIRAVDKPKAFDGVEVTETIDVKGCLVVPGLVDIHTHLREPGQEWKETVGTGTSAAVAGGFTSVCCMPNTNPVNDSASVTRFILKRAEIEALCRVHPIGSITMGSLGKTMSPYLEMREAGCVAFSDDGHPLYNSQIMRKSLEYNLMLGAVLTMHEEDHYLSEGFSMNESVLSVKMGLKGMPDAAENVMIARDIELARLTGGRVHFAHVSSGRGVELIRRAKEDGVPVTAEVTPHYITLDETAVEGFETNAKMSMPLRQQKDIEALLKGLRDGVIDCVASDHAPHEADSKNVEFDKASFGIIGFQTTVPLILEKVRAGSFSLMRAVDALSTSPSKCFNMEPNSLAAGKVADITVIDPERKITFTPEMNRSKSANTPFFGWEFQGVAVKTFVDGKQVFDFSELEGELEKR